MQLRAIAAYQQALQQTAPERVRQQQRPAPREQQQMLPAPLVAEYFTRNGQPQLVARGVYLDKRV
jgi:hypothetical protein